MADATRCPYCGPGYRYGVDGCRHKPEVSKGSTMPDRSVPPEAYEAAARGVIALQGYSPSAWVSEADLVAELASSPVLRAHVDAVWPLAVAAGVAEGRRQAAEAIETHANKHAPADGNEAQRRLRRHLLIAAMVATPKPTLADRSTSAAWMKQRGS